MITNFNNRVNLLKVQAKINPNNIEAPEKFYLQAIKNGNSDLEHLAYLISNQSTVREPDCLAVLHAFVHNMLDELRQGRVVELGKLGSFQVAVNSSGSETPEDVDISNLKRIRLNYRPSKHVKKALNTLDFKILRPDSD
ncbi:MAG: HU family DNA-binding protein [Bacteroidota bacterium]